MMLALSMLEVEVVVRMEGFCGLDNAYIVCGLSFHELVFLSVVFYSFNHAIHL